MAGDSTRGAASGCCTDALRYSIWRVLAVATRDRPEVQRAASVGLAHTVHPPEQLMQQARGLAETKPYRALADTGRASIVNVSCAALHTSAFVSRSARPTENASFDPDSTSSR